MLLLYLTAAVFCGAASLQTADRTGAALYVYSACVFSASAGIKFARSCR